MATTDRAVQALIDDAWEGEWDGPVTIDALKGAVSLVLRVIRDDMAVAELDGNLSGFTGRIEHYLNQRISSLGAETMTGDTTTPGFAGFHHLPV